MSKRQIITSKDLHIEGHPVPDPGWYGTPGEFCGVYSPTRLSQCLGQPGHAGTHFGISEDWTDQVAEA